MIALATTTITVKGNRPQVAIDPSGYDVVPPMDTLATGVRASITQPRETRNTNGVSEANDYTLVCDPVDVGLSQYDHVIDEKTGVEYEVRSASKSVALVFGLNHVKAVLRESKGLIDESLA